MEASAEVNLFELARAREALVRPPMPEASLPDVKAKPPPLADPVKMREIMTTVAEAMYMPDRATRADLTRRALLPKNHPEYLRSRVARGSWPIEGIRLGKLQPVHFAMMCAARMEPNISGSAPTIIRGAEPYGDWVPTRLDFMDDTEIMMDGLVDADTREVRQIDPMLKPWDVNGTENAKWKKPAPVRRETLEYAMLYVDAKGGTDVKRDRHGEIISATEVSITQSADPALAAAINRLADGQAHDPKDDVIADMQRQMADMMKRMEAMGTSAQKPNPQGGHR